MKKFANGKTWFSFFDLILQVYNSEALSFGKSVFTQSGLPFECSGNVGWSYFGLDWL